MRRKSAAATVILNTRKPTDSSMYTLKKRHMASTVFPVNGGDIGSMIEANGRSGNSHQPLSYQKSTGRPKDSSYYTSYRGSQAIRNDAAYDRGRIEQAPTSIQGSNLNSWNAVSGSSVGGLRPLEIAYGNGIWLAVGETSGTDNIYYTTDPAGTWTAVNGVFGTGFGFGIAYGNGTWVAVGDGSSGDNIWYTSDPTGTWTSVNGPFGTRYGLGIAYGNGTWVSVGDGDSGDNIYYATDPTGTWTAVNGIFGVAGGGYGSGIAYGDGTWVAVGEGDSGNNIYYTTDPTGTWTAVSGPFGSGAGVGIAYGNGTWVAVGQGSSGDNIYYATNPADTWTAVSGPFGIGYGSGIAYGNGTWVAVGESSGTDNIYYTTNPRGNWRVVNGVFGVGGAGFGIAYGNGTWVAVGQGSSGDNIYYSGDSNTLGSCPCLPASPQFFTTGQRTAFTVSTNASSFIKQKLACANQLALMPHTSGQVGPPVFVDDTISLNGYSNCVQNETLRPKAIHDIKAVVPYPTHPPRPSQAGGQYAILGVPTTIPVQYKVGAPLRNIPYVEKHHGNDLNVNPKRAFVRYQGNGPAHNKINKPNFANVKP